MQAAVGRAIETVGVQSAQYRVVWPDGCCTGSRRAAGPSPVDDGRAARMSGVTLNVTDRKLAEATLREADMRFGALADGAPGLLWQTDE